MKTLAIRKAEDEWAVYDPSRPGDYLGSVLRFSSTQFQAWPQGSAPHCGEALDRWFPTRQAAIKALTTTMLQGQ